jgi:hypothetical protein
LESADAERQRLENVKGEVATRKSNLASAHKGIKASHASGTTSLKAEITRLKEKRDLIHQNIAIARRSRCKEAADLLGLTRISSKEEMFSIAGIPLPDLHLLKSMFYCYLAYADYTPMTVMLGISHASHLLTLLTDYLSLKLPHEVLPPSRGISYFTIRRTTRQSKSLPLYLPPEAFSSTSARAWSSKKIKDIPDLEQFVEALSLLAWNVAWVSWSQQLWPYSNSAQEPLECCRLGRNLQALVNSSKIGFISHGSTLDYLPIQLSAGVLPPFPLSVEGILNVIMGALEEDKNGDGDGGGWDMVEGGEEVLRGDGWLKLNSVGHSEG